MPVFKTQNPLDFPLGLLESLATMGSGMASSLASVPYAEIGKLTPEQQQQWIAEHTYMPRTQSGQGLVNMLGEAGKYAEETLKLPPIMPELQGLAQLAAHPAAQAQAGLLAKRGAQEVGRAAAQGIENQMVRQGQILPIDVWHGSPYKFERFDQTKIGSGEGAQAYGYGHYVAEAPEVAHGYKNSVTSTKYDTADGVESAGSLIQKIIDLSGNKTPGLNSAISMKANEVVRDMILGTPAKDIVSNIRNSKYSRTYSGIADALERLRPQKAIGNVYKIDLPDEHVAKMLNWDQELGKQSPEIQALAKQHGLAMDDLGGDLVARMNAKKPEGAEAMRQAGIPGIKYFDAQSRGGKQANTQNFVVFPGNEGLLSILERNGQKLEQPSGLLDLAYRGQHTSPNPEFGAPLHDLTGGGQMYPADVYSSKATQYYGTGYPKADKEAFDLAKRVKGNPDAEVTMYRAVPKGIKQINEGDWVTLSKDYAKTHGESVLNNDFNIIEKKVKAKDLWTNADSIHEFGYHPQK